MGGGGGGDGDGIEAGAEEFSASVKSWMSESWVRFLSSRSRSGSGS